MSIWFDKTLTLSHFADWVKNNMAEHVGIEFTELGDDYLTAKMPVDHRTKQTYGLLHGGASVVLAETIGSIASALVVDHSKYLTLGIEINANHIHSVSKGFVLGTCRAIKLGASIHVWEIKIVDGQEQLICISRLTTIIKKRK